MERTLGEPELAGFDCFVRDFNHDGLDVVAALFPFRRDLVSAVSSSF